MSLPTSGQPLFSAGYKRWLMTVLMLVYVFNIMDRIVIAALGQAIKLDLRISDLQLGILQGLAFAVLYAVLGLPIARLAERWNRVVIISVAVAIWSSMTALCGTARTYAQFLVFRIGVGIGDAGFVAPAASLIGDYFPPERRGSAMSFLSLGVPIGALLGATMGGWIAEHMSWRIAFVIVGLPGLVLALVAVCTLREPPRGYSEGITSTTAPPPIMDVLRHLFARPTYRHLAAGIALAGFGTTAIGQFLHMYLVRVYHLGYAEAGLMVGIVSAVSLSCGLMIGGFGGDRLVRRDRRWHAWLPAIGVGLAGPLYMLGFMQPTAIRATIVFLFSGMALFVNVGPSAAMTQNMVGPRMRASAAYVNALFLTLFGAGLGPTTVGFLSDRFAAHSFQGIYATACPGGVPPVGAAPDLAAACRAASAMGLREAFIVTAALFIWAAVHYWLAARTLKRDLYVAEAAPVEPGEAALQDALLIDSIGTAPPA